MIPHYLGLLFLIERPRAAEITTVRLLDRRNYDILEREVRYILNYINMCFMSVCSDLTELWLREGTKFLTRLTRNLCLPNKK